MFLGDIMSYLNSLFSLFIFLFNTVLQPFMVIVALFLAGGVFGGVLNLIRRIIRGLINEED